MYESLPTSLLQWPHLLSFLLGYLVAQPSKLREIHQVAVPVVLKALSSVAPIRRAATATWVLAKVTVSTRSEVEKNWPYDSWQRKSFESFATMLLSKDPVDFPCVYATKGFKAHEHLYVFVDSEDPSSPRGVQSIAAALRQYISRSKTLGPNTSLVVLTPETNAVRSLEEYNRMFWDILHGVSKLDSQEWPADIPQDIDTPRWRFCFEGEQWFTVALTPAHRYRRSRRASCFCVLFQPKWVFDVLFSTPLKKQGAMDKVRGLLAVYDDVNISPEMKPYGDETGREYKQYFLLDENVPAPCPFPRLAGK